MNLYINKVEINMDDIINIYEIGKESLPIYYNLNTLISMIQSDNYIIYKVYNEKKIYGYVVIREIDDKIHICSISVRNKYRNKGIGGIMMRYLQNIYKRISLYVQSTNEIANNFYKKNGFKRIYIEKDYYMSLDDKVGYYYEWIR